MNKGLLIFLIVLVVILIGVSGGILYWLLAKGSSLDFISSKVVTPTPTLTQPTPTPGFESAPTVEEKSDLQQIKEAFAEKYDKVLTDVKVTISDNDGTYAKGGVSFAGEMVGGWWLAFKDTVGWIIVADGNGAVMCSSIESYDFPIEMVPECYDEDSGTLVTF